MAYITIMVKVGTYVIYVITYVSQCNSGYVCMFICMYVMTVSVKLRTYVRMYVHT